eukprot:1932260-Karenia_brevis.AAC.1
MNSGENVRFCVAGTEGQSCKPGENETGRSAKYDWSKGCGDASRVDPPFRNRIKLACGEAVSVNPAITCKGDLPILEDSSDEESKGSEKQDEEDD